MSVSDTEVSDLTWTDNGTFNLSEGHTPQTDNSDGLFSSTNGSYYIYNKNIIYYMENLKMQVNLQSFAVTFTEERRST